jgi:Na+/melibiose symporter-like transporter
VIGLLGLAFSGPVMLLFLSQVKARGPGSLSLFGLANGIGGLAGLPLWSFLARRFGKKRACIAAYTVHALMALSWWLGAPGEPDAAFAARGFLLGLSGQGSLTLGLAMLLDVMAHGRRESGESREGLMVGVFALAEKGAFAFGPLLTGLLLGAMGFVSSTSGQAVQPPEAVLAARLAMSVIPAVIGAVAIVALLAYRLPDEMQRAGAEP